MAGVSGRIAERMIDCGSRTAPRRRYAGRRMTGSLLHVYRQRRVARYARRAARPVPPRQAAALTSPVVGLRRPRSGRAADIAGPQARRRGGCAPVTRPWIGFRFDFPETADLYEDRPALDGVTRRVELVSVEPDPALIGAVRQHPDHPEDDRRVELDRRLRTDQQDIPGTRQHVCLRVDVSDPPSFRSTPQAGVFWAVVESDVGTARPVVHRRRGVTMLQLATDLPLRMTAEDRNPSLRLTTHR